MTVTAKNIVAAKQAEATDTNQYTAVNCTTIIDKFTVTNTTASAATFSAHIVPQGGAVGVTYAVISGRSISPGETYQCPELVGQIMAPNSFLSTVAGTASALSIRGSGREVT